MEPKTDYTNKMYGGTDIKGHNIIFVNAEEDPGNGQACATTTLHTTLR